MTLQTFWEQHGAEVVGTAATLSGYLLLNAFKYRRPSTPMGRAVMKAVIWACFTAADASGLTPAKRPFQLRDADRRFLEGEDEEDGDGAIVNGASANDNRAAPDASAANTDTVSKERKA